jgi:serine/threonine-protein kinase
VFYWYCFIGKVIDSRYEILEQIGRGGMAKVYKAKDRRLNRIVAIKVLKEGLSQDEKISQKFEQEALSAASLNHSGIVSVYDTGEFESIPYIVMELIQGQTLKEIMKRDGKIDILSSVKIAEKIAGALQYSHERGIIHQDIKPANIMILPSGEIKVMDFGIARAINNPTDNPAIDDQTNSVVGTAQYLSPEQAKGEMTDSRSDIYSLGIVLYELATGVLPFTGDSAVAIAYQQVHTPPKPPSSINPKIPKIL